MSLPFVVLPNDTSSRGSLVLVGVVVMLLVLRDALFVLRPDLARGLAES